MKYDTKKVCFAERKICSWGHCVIFKIILAACFPWKQNEKGYSWTNRSVKDNAIVSKDRQLRSSSINCFWIWDTVAKWAPVKIGSHSCGLCAFSAWVGIDCFLSSLSFPAGVFWFPPVVWALWRHFVSMSPSKKKRDRHRVTAHARHKGRTESRGRSAASRLLSRQRRAGWLAWRADCHSILPDDKVWLLHRLSRSCFSETGDFGKFLATPSSELPKTKVRQRDIFPLVQIADSALKPADMTLCRWKVLLTFINVVIGALNWLYGAKRAALAQRPTLAQKAVLANIVQRSVSTLSRLQGVREGWERFVPDFVPGSKQLAASFQDLVADRVDNLETAALCDPLNHVPDKVRNSLNEPDGIFDKPSFALGFFDGFSRGDRDEYAKLVVRQLRSGKLGLSISCKGGGGQLCCWKTRWWPVARGLAWQACLRSGLSTAEAQTFGFSNCVGSPGMQWWSSVPPQQTGCHLLVRSAKASRSSSCIHGKAASFNGRVEKGWNVCTRAAATHGGRTSVAWRHAVPFASCLADGFLLVVLHCSRGNAECVSGGWDRRVIASCVWFHNPSILWACCWCGHRRCHVFQQCRPWGDFRGCASFWQSHGEARRSSKSQERCGRRALWYLCWCWPGGWIFSGRPCSALSVNGPHSSSLARDWGGFPQTNSADPWCLTMVWLIGPSQALCLQCHIPVHTEWEWCCGATAGKRSCGTCVQCVPWHFLALWFEKTFFTAAWCHWC